VVGRTSLIADDTYTIQTFEEIEILLSILALRRVLAEADKPGTLVFRQ